MIDENQILDVFARKGEDKYSTVDSIVRNTLARQYRDLSTYYEYYLQFALLGVKKLNFDVMVTPKTEVLKKKESDPYLTLPPDYVDYGKVGIIRNRRIYTLDVNPNMSFPINKDDCGNENPKATQLDCFDWAGSDSPGWWYDNVNTGGYYGGYFGKSADKVKFGYFRIDEDKHRIIFSSDIGEEDVIIEYTSNGISNTGETKIHVYAEQALIEWTDWQSLLGRRNVPSVEKREAERRFWKEWTATKRRFMKLSLQDLKKYLNKGNINSVKR